MTKAQRNKRDFILAMNERYSQDRWGHYKIDLADGRQYRFKMQKASVRIERIVSGRYFRVHTIPYGKLTIDEVAHFLGRVTK